MDTNSQPAIVDSEKENHICLSSGSCHVRVVVCDGYCVTDWYGEYDPADYNACLRAVVAYAKQHCAKHVNVMISCNDPDFGAKMSTITSISPNQCDPIDLCSHYLYVIQI